MMLRVLTLPLVSSALMLQLGTLAVVGGEPTGPLAGFAVERSWTDDTGRFKIEAKLQFADASEVKLLKSDGRAVTVPLAKLSKPDQAFIDTFLKAEAALKSAGGLPGESADDPFAGGELAGDSDAMTGSGKSDPSSRGAPSSPHVGPIPQRKAIVKGIRPLSLAPAREFWSVSPLRPVPAAAFQELVLETEIAKPFFAAQRLLAAGTSGNVVLNVYQQGRGNRENFGHFTVVNAVTGDSSAVQQFEEPWKLLAIAPDGSRLAAVRVEGFDKGNDLAIFRIVEGGIAPEFQFTAGGGSWDELHFAAFLPQNRLVTISQKHDLTVWDLENTIGVKAIQRGPSGGALSAELSPAGDVMAIVFGSSIALVETDNFKLVGSIAGDEPHNSLAFSPDGLALAAFRPFNVTLYAMETGQTIKSIAVSEAAPNTVIRWVGQHLLVGSVLYDVERGMPLWTYETRATDQTTSGSHLLSVFGGDNGSTLTVFQLPHDEAARAAANVDPANIYCIKPEDSIAVEYQLAGVTPAVQQEIRKAVEEKIASLQWKLARSATNKMIIQLAPGQPEQAEYYTRTGFGPMPFFAPPPGFGGPRPTGPAEKVQFTPWTHALTIQANGQQVFHTTYLRGAPQQLTTNDGESTQAAVLRICQPSPQYFQNAAIPPYLLKPEYQGGLGKTSISATGMR
jgi:hypothetical protein